MRWLAPILLTICLGYADDSLEETSTAQLDFPAFSTTPPASSPFAPSSTPVETPTKSARTATLLSMLMPGLGHTYLGDYRTAGELFGTFSTSVTGATLGRHSQDAFMPSLVMAQNTWFYGIYAAYRDATLMNGETSHSYTMPTETFADLTYAPFNHKVLRKPEVWGGILGSLALGITVSHFAFKNIDTTQGNTIKKAPTVVSAFPVAIGEEAYFRGYVQTKYAEKLSPWAAITLSSLDFGIAHLPNALLLPRGARMRYCTCVVPLITTLGVYFGWLTYKNHSIQESTAVHAWYDFALFLGQALATSSITKSDANFAFTIAF